MKKTLFLLLLTLLTLNCAGRKVVIVVDDVFDVLAKDETPSLYHQIRNAAIKNGVSPVFFIQKTIPDNSKKMVEILKKSGKSDVVITPYVSIPDDGLALLKDRKLYTFVNQSFDFIPISVELNRDEAFSQAARYLGLLTAGNTASQTVTVVSLSDTVSRRRELMIFEQTLKVVSPQLRLEILVMNRESERERIAEFLKNSVNSNPACWVFFAGKFNAECFEAVSGTLIPSITENTRLSLFEVFNISASINLDWGKAFLDVFSASESPVLGASLKVAPGKELEIP